MSQMNQYHVGYRLNELDFGIVVYNVKDAEEAKREFLREYGLDAMPEDSMITTDGNDAQFKERYFPWKS